ncbi:Pimeloyl-ACP methyl ester carboxylesterase [Amycolatopsis pretoriensis]|uniref:Pimeloyl-ACP methyl ester carboxylesterase n=1 Tax=Amycolatopsis pretoriensis TaxID=218821 RepID=A0A1H5Q6W6_9PSEU|nr:alpha/beta hydrolase [Amycolatopsis pretoriensis]SEF21826.1 Pimeloyl-ACP methyl ester carboxylesterase [Amycolatopsis pretoriensis]
MTAFALADGTSLQVVRRGDPAAPVTVVFVHGYALDQCSWGRVAPLVPDAAEGPVAVVTYDQRGHGGSGRARRGTATMAQLGDDLAELLEREVPAGRVVLVGHDMGGLAIMSLSQRHPALFEARVSGLVLLATSSGTLATEVSAAWPNALGKLARDLEAVLGSKLFGVVREHTSRAVSAGLRWWLFGDDPDPELVELTVKMIRGNWPHTVSLFRPALDAYARDAALAQVSGLPVTAIVGERDRIVRASDVEEWVGGLDDGTAVVLPGVGHVVPLEAAAQVLPRVVALVNAGYRQDESS